jgi:hypothetical protein
MSATGLDVFNTTLHKTHSWLNELMPTLGLARQTAGALWPPVAESSHARG